MDHVQGTVDELQSKNSTLLSSLEAADETLEGFQSQNHRLFAHLEQFGGLQKLTNTADRVVAIGTTLLSFLAIMMKSKHPITRLRTVCECLFENAIFGEHVTKQVLHELYKKYIYEEQKLLFSPWKLLKAIDMSAVGGLNYNGIETLQSLEKLNPFERGLPPG